MPRHLAQKFNIIIYFRKLLGTIQSPLSRPQFSGLLDLPAMSKLPFSRLHETISFRECKIGGEDRTRTYHPFRGHGIQSRLAFSMPTSPYINYHFV